MGELALGAFEFAEEAIDKFRHGSSVINVAWGQTKNQQFASIVNDQMQFEAVELSDSGFAAGSPGSLHPVLMDARVAANRKGSGVDEADPATAAQLSMQIAHEWHP